MSDGLAWGIVAIILAAQMFMWAMAFAPPSFWAGMTRQHPYAARFLWGFSHWGVPWPGDDDE